MTARGVIRLLIVAICVIQVGKFMGVVDLEKGWADRGMKPEQRIARVVGSANPRLDDAKRRRIAHAVVRCERQQGLDPNLERGISAYFWGSSIRGDRYLERVRSIRETLAGVQTRPSSDG